MTDSTRRPHHNDDPSDLVPLKDYSRALDEIWLLRRALAYEAAVAEVHGEYKAFPKSRRRVLADQVERMRTAARGQADRAYAGTAEFIAWCRTGVPALVALVDARDAAIQAVLNLCDEWEQRIDRADTPLAAMLDDFKSALVSAVDGACHHCGGQGCTYCDAREVGR